MSVNTGWTGRCFEDFVVGDLYIHPLGKTITAVDNAWFTNLTLNTNPLHFDQHFAAAGPFGRTIVNSCLTLALVTGISVSDTTMFSFANLGWDEVRLPAPVFEGDTIYARSEVLAKRESHSRPETGIVELRTEGFNQDAVVVLTFRRTIMVFKRDSYPISPSRRVTDGG